MKYTPVTVKWDLRYEAKAWCTQQFGRTRENTSAWSKMPWWGQPVQGKRYNINAICNYRFYFLDPEHATMFKLRFYS